MSGLKIADLDVLCKRILAAQHVLEKLEIVDSVEQAHLFLNSAPQLKSRLLQLDLSAQFLIKALLAIGQGPVVFREFSDSTQEVAHLHQLLSCLQEIERFYDVIGGIVGYQILVLKLIHAKNHSSLQKDGLAIHYDEPKGMDISIDAKESRQAVRWGIEHLNELIEIYPIGGAGDRLNLKDEKTGQLLPAAELPFCGRSLLEGMLRDQQGREFLYYKLTGKQAVTPVVLMTSDEKDNHAHVVASCEKNRWFGKGKERIFLMKQPLVPMVTEEGLWAMHAPLHPILKPGGHGVIWKVALDAGVFEWAEDYACHKALVRQINNPIAGVDNGLLALAGIGCHGKKKMGFASCPRLLNVSEGMDVLCEKQTANGYEYCITNIEYTDFKQLGIDDTPKSPGSPFSQFPANTNILFVDLKAIKPLIAKYPIPGALINMKTKVKSLLPDGSFKEQQAGRLESTMQNIADHMIDTSPKRLEDGGAHLSTFITYNKREKTISVAKQAFEAHKSFVGTPEGSHFDMMQNYSELLAQACHFTMPLSRDEKAYLDQGPAVLIDFHPALGGLYSVIAQKLRGGEISIDSEWVMEIAEVDIAHLHLNGSLQIRADHVMGKTNSEEILVYDSAHCGKCTLINVNVQNLGVCKSAKNVFWKHRVERKESLCITLHGNGEFFAQDVNFLGDFHFEVPDGHRMIVSQDGHGISKRLEKIKECTWMWHYAFDDENRIILNK